MFEVRDVQNNVEKAKAQGPATKLANAKIGEARGRGDVSNNCLYLKRITHFTSLAMEQLLYKMIG